jgi:hypothetical protein
MRFFDLLSESGTRLLIASSEYLILATDDGDAANTDHEPLGPAGVRGTRGPNLPALLRLRGPRWEILVFSSLVICA